MPSKKKLKRHNRRLREKIGVLKHQRKLAERDAKLWRSIVEEQDIEIEQLKAPKVTITDSNGESMEFHNSKGVRQNDE